jgi:hypothetical protein
MSARIRLEDYKSSLVTPIGRASSKGDIRTKRETNIVWIQQLDRQGLEYGKAERQILIDRTRAGEQLFLQYPGKESARDDSFQRPWDFRPKIELTDGTYGPDWSFGDVWDNLFVKLDVGTQESVEVARILSVLFYRMAFMMDHEEAPRVEAKTRDVHFPHERVSEYYTRGYGRLFRYKPPLEVVDALSSRFGDWGGMSLEGFLHLNDLMAWNEDVKYYYRETEGGSEEWNWPRTGRINNLLTHVSVLGIITGDLKLTRLLNKFQRQRGVATVTGDEAETISKGLIG